MNIERTYHIKNRPIRTFEEEGKTWFCANDLLVAFDAKHENYDPPPLLIFVNREEFVEDPHIRELQYWLNAQLSH